MSERLEHPLLHARITPTSGARALDLLRHPVLVGLGGPLTSADGGVMAMLADLAARAAGPVELACTGTLPARSGTAEADRPLLLFRAVLEREDAVRLAEILAGGGMAMPLRKIGSHQTYRLALEDPAKAGAEPSGSEPSADARPGKDVEVVLAGSDLLVSNHGRALEEVLGANALHGPPLSEDPDYRRLSERLHAGPGAVHVFADVRRLMRHAPSELRRLPLPRRALATLEPDGRSLSISLVLDLGEDGFWSTALKPARARELVGELGGGGLVLSLMNDVPVPGRGTGVGSRTADGRSGRGVRWLLEMWQRAGHELGATVRLEKKNGHHLLLASGEQGSPRQGSPLALLRDLGSARREVVGLFAFSVPVPGGGGMRLAGSLEPESGADGERLLRVRALCATDG